MLILGVLYIAFEKSILQQVKPDGDGLASAQADGVSRAILGVQVRSQQLFTKRCPLTVVPGWPHCDGYACYSLKRCLSPSESWPSFGHTDCRLDCSW